MSSPTVPLDHPDYLRWNKKYLQQNQPQFKTHPLISEIIATDLCASLPAGPVLELAAGLSGSILELAKRKCDVWAVDISDVALNLLTKEAHQRNLPLKIVHADLEHWLAPEQFALIYAIRFWHKETFINSCKAVLPGGLIAWEALTEKERLFRPTFSQAWCLLENEPAKFLPEDFVLLKQEDEQSGRTRRLIARRQN